MVRDLTPLEKTRLCANALAVFVCSFIILSGGGCFLFKLVQALLTVATPPQGLSLWTLLGQSVAPAAVIVLACAAFQNRLKCVVSILRPPTRDEEIVVRFKLARGAMGVLSLAFSGLLAIPAAFIFFIFAVYAVIFTSSGAWSVFDHGMGLGFVIFATISLGLSLNFIRILMGGSVQLSASGIDCGLPMIGAGIETGETLKHEWAELRAVSLLGGHNNKESNTAALKGSLCLDFDHGGTMLLQLAQVDHANLQKFFRALELWCAPQALSKDILALKHLVMVGEQYNAETVLPSFTQVWQDSLDNAHLSTAYVPLRNGEHLQDGRYRIVSQISCGGLSTVYMAETHNGGTVVIKECALPDTSKEASKKKADEMFAREAQMLGTLKHPNIATLMDVFDEQSRKYIVMEFIAGSNLRQLISVKGRQPEQVVLNWAKQILSVLQYLHSLDPPVLHRDVTPDNIVLDNDGKIMVIDFGAANHFVSHATGTLVGKQCYIAPEQFRGKATTRSDIFAFGATMHYLLTGVDPEPLESSSPADVNPAVSAEVSELVFHSTQPEEADRIASVDELLEAVNSLIEKGVIGDPNTQKNSEGKTISLKLESLLRSRVERK